MLADERTWWQPNWVAPPRSPVLEPGRCDLWRVDLDGLAAGPGGDPACAPLDPIECARAARFVFERHRRAYVAARTALRRVLGAYLGLEAGEVPLLAAPFERPYLRGRTLDFNLSHSDGVALIAVAAAPPLGVDVERLRPLRDALELAQRLYVAEEIDRVVAAQEGEPRQRVFLTCWTRKEAVLKSTGIGLRVEPNTVACGALPGPRDLVFNSRGEAVPLRVSSFAVYDDAVGAVAFAPDVVPGGTYTF